MYIYILRKLLYWRLADQCWLLQLICATWLNHGDFELWLVSFSIFWLLNHGGLELWVVSGDWQFTTILTEEICFRHWVTVLRKTPGIDLTSLKRWFVWGRVQSTEPKAHGNMQELNDQVVRACPNYWAKGPWEHTENDWLVILCVCPRAFGPVVRTRSHQNQLRVTWDQRFRPAFTGTFSDSCKAEPRVWESFHIYWRLADQCWLLQLTCVTRL